MHATLPEVADKTLDLQPLNLFQPQAKPPLWKQGRIQLVAVGIVLFLTSLTVYLIHASHHETTDDAYTRGHVHSISSRVAGTVVDVAVDDNQRVPQGQVLVRLDTHDFQVDVDKAQAEYDRSKSNFDRIEALKSSMAISQQDFDQTQAALRVAKATLDDTKNQLSYCTIAAPAPGIVGNKLVETGNRLAVGSVLMSVVEDVWIVANYKETQVGRMRLGQRVKIHVDAISGRTFDGHIDSFSPGSGSTFALLPPENATGNFTKIVQRVPVKIVFERDSIRGYENQIVPGLSIETDVDLASAPSSMNAAGNSRETASIR